MFREGVISLVLLYNVIAVYSCEILITVDQSRAQCDYSSPFHNGTCNDLQTVLLSVSESSLQQSVDCIEITLLPGEHLITQAIVVTQSVVIAGSIASGVVGLSFELSDPRVSTSQDPYYVLQFSNTKLAEITGVTFHRSRGLIGFEDVENVVIKDCSFRYFSQGAVDIYNCKSTEVDNCIFEHNGPVSVVKPYQYRGHAGGLSLGYHDSVEIEQPVARVSRCNFYNNTSDPLANVQSTSQLFQKFIFTGRGGGCSIVVNSVSSLNASFEDCSFESNYARSYGGGLYTGFSGKHNHSITVNRVKFRKNRSSGAGGALEIGFVQGASLYSTNSLSVQNSEFTENHAGFGGCIYVFVPGPTRPDGTLSNFVRVETSTFSNNTADQYGASIGLINLLTFSNRNIKPMEISNCNFSKNDGGRGGVVSSTYLSVSFSGQIRFSNNRGRALVVLGSSVSIYGKMYFHGNVASGVTVDGSAVYVTSFGQLRLFPGTEIIFEKNVGVLGAAIIADIKKISAVYSQLSNNPLCFLLYEDPTLSPNNWKNISITFSQNSALVGSAIYASAVDLCSWDPQLKIDEVFQWNFINYMSDNVNSAHSPDESNPEWFVQTPADSTMITTAEVAAHPGELFEVGIMAIDELNKPTASVVRLSELADTKLLFSPSVVTLNHIEQAVVNTSFYISSQTSSQVITVNDILSDEDTEVNFVIKVHDCPPGYVLSQSPTARYSTCECGYNDVSIIECDGSAIYLKDGLWAVAVNGAGGYDLMTRYCPAGYCKCTLKNGVCKYIFDSTAPDEQCTCARKGLLCGECRNGTGVSALLNECVTCHSASALLIAVLIVLDLLVFVAILLAAKYITTWFYPCIFYLQILPLITEDFPLTFEELHKYVYYFSSGTSFYFVYDFCLYKNMSIVISYALRFLPFFLFLSLCIPVYFIRKRLHVRTKFELGLWWIFLLQCTHIVYTSISILNCPSLPDENGKITPHWYFDGSIKCFAGSHIPIGVMAILVLVLCVFIGVLLLCYSLKLLKSPSFVSNTVELLKIGYKDVYSWWPVVELGRRFVLLPFVAAYPGNEYPTIFILALMCTLYGFLQPYKQTFVNVLEVFLSLDVLVLLLLRSTNQVVEDLQHFSGSVLDSAENNCTEQDSTRLTALSWLLSPLYYIPLAAVLITVGMWLALLIRRYFPRKESLNLEVDDDYVSPEYHTASDVTTYEFSLD